MKKNSLIVFIFCQFAQAVDLNPLHWLASFNAANAFEHGAYDRAKKELAGLLDHADEHPEAIFNAGNLAYAANDWQKAAAYFDAAAQHEKALPELKKQAHYNHGNSLTQADQLEKAVQAYQKVRELDPAHEPAAHMIEQIERELKKRKEQQQHSNQKNDSSKNRDNKNKQDQEKDNDDKNDQSNDGSSDNTNNDDRDENQPEDNGGDRKKDQSKERKKTGDERDEQRGDEREKKDGDNSKKSDTQDQQEAGAGDKRDEKKQKPFNQGPPKPEAKEQEKNEQPHDSSPGNDLQNDSQSTGNARKMKASDKAEMAPAQEAIPDERFSDADQQLMKLLDQHDAQSLKQLLKVDVKQSMPGHHGQKNW